MTSSSQIEPWLYRSTPFSDTWLSETQTITKALQQSLSYSTSPTSSLYTPSATARIPDPPPTRKNPIPVATKPSKRRSRASKRSTTTFITADPANFRQMVQQVTGVRFSGGVFPVKPEPIRSSERGNNNAEYLPTLDTSAYLLNQICPPAAPPAAAAAAQGGGGFDFEAFSCFPTLESWKVI